MAAATAEPRDRLLDPERTLDERSARAALRKQISRLERRLSDASLELWNARALQTIASGPDGRARMLTFAELEATRDALVDRVRVVENRVRATADSQARVRSRLEAILADPAEHRYAVVHRADLGEPGCGAYHVLPRMGLVGMLFGWWCVKLSSGCP